MARQPASAARRSYTAARLVRQQAFEDHLGVCAPPRRTWTSPLLGELARRVDLALEANGSFTERWQSAMGGADDPLRVLAGEVTAVHLLIASDITPATRWRLVRTAWAGVQPAPVLDPLVVAALDAGGVVPGGAGFGLRRLSQLGVIVHAALALRTMTPAVRRACLDDPWAWRGLLDSLDVSGGHAQRAALCHLLHPATFEAIISARLKARIARGVGTPDDPPDTDRRLLAARRRLAAEHGRRFSYLDAAVARTWRS